MPPVTSFWWPPRMFELETATVQSEFAPDSRLAGLKARIGSAGLVSFLIRKKEGKESASIQYHGFIHVCGHDGGD